MNPHVSGMAQALGLELMSASADEVIVEWDITPAQHQPMGIVHGGVHCAVIETVCSLSAGLAASQREPSMVAVGLENHTSFIRGVRSGRLRAVATPVTRGRTTQVWEATVRNEEGAVLARGTVRLLNVRADTAFSAS